MGSQTYPLASSCPTDVETRNGPATGASSSINTVTTGGLTVESFAPVEPVIGPTRPIFGEIVWPPAASSVTLPENDPSPSEMRGISLPEMLTIIAKSLWSGR